MGELRYCFSFFSCKIFILSIILFSSQANTSLAQNDYKISTEGFVFKNPTKDNVTLAVYFSVVNIGAVSDFYGPLRNIKLSYMQSGSKQTTRHIDSRIVMRDDNEDSHYAIVELLYNIPRTVTQLKISSPDHPVSDAPIVESIIYDKSFNDYEKTGGKDIVYEDGSKGKKSRTTAQEIVEDWVGFSFGLGGGYDLKTNYPSFVFDLSIYPQILSVSDFFYLGGSLTWSFQGMSEGSIRKAYNLSEGEYQSIQNRGDTAKFDAHFLGGGLGFGFDLGFFRPTMFINYGNYELSGRGIRFRNNETGVVLNGARISGPAWRFDLLLGTSRIINFKYSFVYFDHKSSVPEFNKIFRNHLLTIGIGGLIISGF